MSDVNPNNRGGADEHGDSGMSPQQFVLGTVDAALSLWALRHQDGAVRAAGARDVLATWAHLQRFERTSLDQVLWNRIDAVVRASAPDLVSALADVPVTQHWAQQARELTDQWDAAASNIERQHLVGDEIALMFYRLDDASLAVAAAEHLVRSLGLPARAPHSLVEATRDAEAMLADEPEVFLPAAHWASSMLSAYRSDLDSDLWLWQATLKYARLEQTLEAFDFEARLHLPESPDEVLHLLDPVRTARRLLKGLRITAEMHNITRREGFVTVELYDIPNPTGRGFGIGIKCGADEPVDWTILAVSVRSPRALYCRALDQNGQALFPYLGVGTYDINTQRVKAVMENPAGQFGRVQSPDGNVVLRMTSGHQAVEIANPSGSLGDRTLRYVVVDGKTGAAQIEERQVVLRPHPSGGYLGIGSITGIEGQVDTLAASDSDATSMQELLVFLPDDDDDRGTT